MGFEHLSYLPALPWRRTLSNKHAMTKETDEASTGGSSERKRERGQVKADKDNSTGKKGITEVIDYIRWRRRLGQRQTRNQIAKVLARKCVAVSMGFYCRVDSMLVRPYHRRSIRYHQRRMTST